MIRWVIALAMVAAALLADPATAAPSRLNNLQTVARMLTDGRNPRMIRINFDTANLPSEMATAYKTYGAAYYVLAAATDGKTYNFTSGGWKQATAATMAPYTTLKTSFYSSPSPVVVLPTSDISGLVGVALYAGIAVGDDLYYAYLGSIGPARPLIPASFPFASGIWRVQRTVDPINDKASCMLYADIRTPDGRYDISPYWARTAKGELISLGLSLYGATTGSYLFGASKNDSMIRLDSNTASIFSDVVGSASYYLVPGTIKTEGPNQLYGNFEPILSQIINGTNMIVQFVSSAGTTRYTVSAPVAGFPQAMDAFDYCLLTQ